MTPVNILRRHSDMRSALHTSCAVRSDIAQPINRPRVQGQHHCHIQPAFFSRDVGDAALPFAVRPCRREDLRQQVGATGRLWFEFVVAMCLRAALARPLGDA